MKPLTDRQRVAIFRLARATKTELKNVDEMSSFEASKVIEGLLKRLEEQKKGSRTKQSSNYSSDALAGLAVKILAQRTDVEEIIGKEGLFRERAAKLYKVFSSARQKCLA